MEDFVETHVCKLCVILRSRVLRDVYVLVKGIGRRLPLVLQWRYPHIRRYPDKNDACYGRGAPVFFSNTTPQFRSLRPLPKKLIWKKMKMLLDEKSHGPGTQR